MAKKRTTPEAITKTDTQTPVPSAHDAGPTPIFPVVGIGASAGGLDALKRFFEATPADSGAAFVVIQHLDPMHKSLTAELLAAHTTMPVIEATDTMRVAPDHVYTIPHNRDPVFDRGALRLTEREQKRDVHAPIDTFFSSLADAIREAAAGLILTGAGSDGAAGIKAIKTNDGLTMAQAPQTALYDSMPKAAIATGCVDYVLPLEEMPRALTQYLRNVRIHDGQTAPGKTASDIAATHEFKSILALMRAHTGYDLDSYKKGTQVRRIARRMGLVRIEHYRDYLELLRQDRAEVSALTKDLFIGVTEFFRDPAAWAALNQQIIKPLVARKEERATIRVWAPGCSTGEEAYSIAMLVLDELETTEKNCRLQIFASDIDNSALEFARRGIYPCSVAEAVGEGRLRRFFSVQEEGQYCQASKRLRDVVVFAQQNLLGDAPFSRLDLVVCRNLLIYVELDIQKNLIGLFHFALNEQGALFLGNAETLGNHQDLFETVDKKWRIFERGATPARIFRPELRHELLSATKDRAPDPAKISHSATLAQRQLLERYVPAAVLIDQQYNLLYFWGATEDYLAQPTGAPTQNLLAQLRPGLRSKLKSAAQQAAREDQTVLTDVRVNRGTAIVKAMATVSIVRDGNRADKLLLITFDEQAEMVTAPREIDDSPVQRLEAELKVAKEDLQGTIEQFESADEEMKAANEEVTSINEELQTINEELEASKEELQLVNKELATVNAQLQGKLEELHKTNTDLTNLLDSTEVATIFLDRRFRITRFTPTTIQLLPLEPADVGRLISVFAQSFDVNLLRDAEQVLEKVLTVEAQVQTDDGRWYHRRLLPYRMTDQRIEGVVMTYTNITELKNEQQRAAAAFEQLQAINTVAEQRTVELRALGTELAFAEERQRQQLATDLHDGLSQNLALALLKLNSLPISKTKRFARVTDEVVPLLTQAIEMVRLHIVDLSPPVLEDFGLGPALEWLAENISKNHGLKVNVRQVGDISRIDEQMQFMLFRAARELLTNVVKHAGVGNTTLVLKATKRDIRLVVEDGGKGFDPVRITRENSGFGLPSLVRRFSYLGGEVNIQSAPGQGSKIMLQLPLTRTRAPRGDN